MRAFVTVGNALDPFERLLRMVDEALPPEGVEGVCQHGVSVTRPHGLRSVATLPRAEFDAELGAADVVICHAGVGTLWSAIEAGHRPIVMPRLARFGEIVNDHQLEICRELEREGRIVVVSSVEQLARAAAAPTRRSKATQREDAAPRPVADALDALSACHPRARPGLLRALAAFSPALSRLRVR